MRTDKNQLTDMPRVDPLFQSLSCMLIKEALVCLEVLRKPVTGRATAQSHAWQDALCRSGYQRWLFVAQFEEVICERVNLTDKHFEQPPSGPVHEHHSVPL